MPQPAINRTLRPLTCAQRRAIANSPSPRVSSQPTGAAYQGIVFGFVRADNPHLQVEIDKVRTGSKRLQRVGDIDCWEGSRLAISAEVKQLTLKTDAVPDLEAFGNATGKRGSLGMVVALAFDEGARDEIEALGLKALDRNDLLRIVELWDPLKQRTAVQSLVYYAQHVEKKLIPYRPAQGISETGRAGRRESGDTA